MPTLVIIALVFAAATTTANQIAPPGRPVPRILRSSGAVVRVQLLDARSGAPIATTAVVVSSDNGIRCVTTPCPTNAQRWTGKTDAKGMVDVPSKVLQASTTIEATGYVAVSLIDDAEEKKGIWVLKLVPKEVVP